MIRAPTADLPLLMIMVVYCCAKRNTVTLQSWRGGGYSVALEHDLSVVQWQQDPRGES
jgi:hypothetical protein